MAINSDQLPFSVIKRSSPFCFAFPLYKIISVISCQSQKVRVQITDLQHAAKLAGVQRLLRARLDLLS